MQRANTRKKSETKGQTSKLCEEKTIAKGKTKKQTGEITCKGPTQGKIRRKGQTSKLWRENIFAKMENKRAKGEINCKGPTQGKNQKQRANIKTLEGKNFRTMESKTGNKRKLIAKGQHKENITNKGQTSKLKRKKIFARGNTKGQRGKFKLIAKGPHKEKIRKKRAK